MHNKQHTIYVNRIRDPEHNTNRQGGAVVIDTFKSLTFRDLSKTILQSLIEGLNSFAAEGSLPNKLNAGEGHFLTN